MHACRTRRAAILATVSMLAWPLARAQRPARVGWLSLASTGV